MDKNIKHKIANMQKIINQQKVLIRQQQQEMEHMQKIINLLQLDPFGEKEILRPKETRISRALEIKKPK